MLIWRGWGIIVFLGYFASMAVVFLLQDHGGFDLSERQFPAASLVLHGIFCWFFGMYLHGRSKPRHLIDVDTGQEIMTQEYHDFFFVPVRFWGIACWALAAVVLMGPASPTVRESTGGPTQWELEAAEHESALEEAEIQRKLRAAAQRARERHEAAEAAIASAPPRSNSPASQPLARPRPSSAALHSAEPLAPQLADARMKAHHKVEVTTSTVPYPPINGQLARNNIAAANDTTAAPVAEAPAPWPPPKQLKKLGDQIVHLDFTGNLEFTDADLAKVAQVATLTHLDLSRTGITPDGLNDLKNHPALKSLKLDGCPVAGGLATLSQVPGLVTLHVNAARLNDDDMKALATITSLTELRVGENTITNQGVRELTAMPNLRVIDLHETKITDTALVHLQRLPVVSEIDLRGCQVGKTLLARFEQLMPRTTLRTGEYEPAQSETAIAVATPTRSAVQQATPAAAPPGAGPGPGTGARPGPQAPTPAPAPAMVAAASPASINASHELMRGESKMRRTVMDLSSYRFRHRWYPDSLGALVNGRFVKAEDVTDYWEESYDYFGKGIRYDPFDSIGQPGRIILATAKPHHGHYLVWYSDDRLERVPEEAYKAMRRGQ